MGLSDMSKSDSIYSKPYSQIADFAFDEKVAQVFPDMIRRSAPGYGAILNMLQVFAVRFAKENSNCYDMGCSLGAASLAMRRGIRQNNCRIIAVDNSRAMISRCRKNIEVDPSAAPVEMVCADVRDVKIKKASLVVFNFTLQFVAPKDRLPLLSAVHEGMLSGGALMLSEKISFSNLESQSIQDDLHQTFKQMNGYSDLEISQKRAALERVLMPDPMEKHIERLKTAGFARAAPWFQCFNFASVLAVK